MLSLIETQLKLFIYGLTDSLAFYRTIPTLVNNREALLLTVQILGANGLLILGSVFLFQRGILPLVDVLGGAAFDWYDQNHYNSLLWLLYQSLWLVPICGLCYGCSTAWYQSLADAITKKNNKTNAATKKKDGGSSGLKSVEYAAYATISWLFVFIQVQLLTNYLPSSLSGAEYIVDKVLVATILHTPADSATAVDGNGLVSQLMSHALHQAFLYLFRSVRYITLIAGFIMMSALYGWYAFDPKWISEEIAPDERFAIMEQHLAYFIGFGFPYVLLNQLTSFFIGFGGFMMLFPFCIILGTVTDYHQPYRSLTVAEQNRKFRIFKPAEVWTLFALKYFGKKIVKKAERNFAKTNSISDKNDKNTTKTEASDEKKSTVPEKANKEKVSVKPVTAKKND